MVVAQPQIAALQQSGDQPHGNVDVKVAIVLVIAVRKAGIAPGAVRLHRHELATVAERAVSFVVQKHLECLEGQAASLSASRQDRPSWAPPR